MKRLALGAVVALMAAGASVAQRPPAAPDTGSTGPRPALPAPYATGSHEIFSDIRPFAPGDGPRVPPGFTATRFAERLDSPRNAIVLPGGDVLVAEAKTERKYNDARFRDAGANRITLLRDADGDGVAEMRSVYLANLRQPYGMALIGDRLYVADTDGVFWVPYRRGATAVATSAPRTRIAAFDPGGYNNHWTRNLIASADGRYLYVAVGSASNAGENGMAQERRRATILRLDLTQGAKESVWASGIRNPVGMAFEPAGGQLWTVVNERDHLGDDLVPDYLLQPRQGGFYGWPWFYWGANEDPRLKGQRPDLKPKSLAPDYAVGAHVAALGIGFGGGTRFPAHYRSGAFVARHGSWNRAALAGYDVVFVPFRDGRPAGPVEPFMTGFIAGEKAAHGRPRAVATAGDGSLLVTDDAGGIIWRVAAK